MTAGWGVDIVRHMTTTPNPIRNHHTYEMKGRDKYGRTTYHHTLPGARTVGVIIRMPKTAIEYGMLPYRVTNWITRETMEIRTLAAARFQMQEWAYNATR